MLLAFLNFLCSYENINFSLLIVRIKVKKNIIIYFFKKLTIFRNNILKLIANMRILQIYI